MKKKTSNKRPFKCMTFTFKRHHQPISSIFDVEKRFDFFFVTSIKHLFQLKVFYSRVTQFSMSMSLPVHKFATGIAYLSQSNFSFLLFTEWFVKISMFFRSDCTWRRFNCILYFVFVISTLNTFNVKCYTFMDNLFFEKFVIVYCKENAFNSQSFRYLRVQFEYFILSSAS